MSSRVRSGDGFVQYCPIAIAAEVIGDRWTPLVLRELTLGSTRFNDIQRGMPRISRSLLSGRLRRLEHLGLLTRDCDGAIPYYRLTPAGHDIAGALFALGAWAVRWQLGDPAVDQIDPHWVLWRMHQRLNGHALPAQRVTVQFDFTRPHSMRGWLVLDHWRGTVCVQDPGFDVDVYVTAQAAALQRVWIGRSELDDAIRLGEISIDGPVRFTRAFPSWFAWSPYRDMVAAQHGTASPAPITAR